jgi:hypothetical protein
MLGLGLFVHKNQRDYASLTSFPKGVDLTIYETLLLDLSDSRDRVDIPGPIKAL